MTVLNNTDTSRDVDLDWIKSLEFVFKYGHLVEPRGMKVYECLAYRSAIDMNSPIIMNKRRNLGYKFMAAEAAWIIDGRDDVKSIAPFSKVISQFSDDGVKFFGAYGPPIKDQFPYVLSTLGADEHSRQAVATIWRQSPGPSRDIPCTVSLQWLVRAGQLHCVATMRSSDLWLGHPYDIFNFSALSFYLMLHLNMVRGQMDRPPLELGMLYLTAGSKHIYERNAEAVGGIIDNFLEKGIERTIRKRVFNVERYDSPDEFVSHLWDAAYSTTGALAL